MCASSDQERDPIGRVIQERVKRELAKLAQMKETPLNESSARMVTLLRVFAQHKEPFWELTRRELQALATAELFLEM
jgi:predicted oxidoreductase (fatty acid repression mutant protein)